MADLFIGVVSHASSRFSASQGPSGLAARLVPLLASAGISATVQVNTADLLDESGPAPTSAAVQASLTAQLHAERRWATYLGRPMGARWWAGHGLRWGRRTQQGWRRPDSSMVRRLLNIELSHLDLLRSAADGGHAWALILEDDAECADDADLAHGLAGIMVASGPQPRYVNISQSFSAAELGIQHLLYSVEGVTWEGSRTRSLLGSVRPVTNTVCAILYRGTFLPPLLDALDAVPIEPVLPIDWKLNDALVQLFTTGELGMGDCWLVDPAPIDQLSMQTLR